MGSLKEIQINQQEEWNEFVRKLPTYEPFYLCEYAQAFKDENKNNGIPVLLVYTNDTDYAVNVIFKRDVSDSEHFKELLPKGQYFDIISPYGYGGFCGKISDYNDLNQKYTQYCVENHFISEFVRFNLFGDYFSHYDGVVETKIHNVVRSLELSDEEIWSDFKSNVRRNIKRGEASNISVIVDENGEYLDEFIRIYYLTMELNSANESYFFSKHFFETLNKMKGNVVYFHAVHDSVVISSELVLLGSHNAYFYLGGSDREYSSYRPNDYLKYSIIRWLKQYGYKNYVLGGGYGSDGELFRYKEAFAPHGIVDYFMGKKIIDAVRYQKLVDFRNSTNDVLPSDNFFPQYRG